MSRLKIALRTLAKSPFLTTIAVLSLALGIGANSAIYSMFDEMLMRALPVDEPDRLVNLANPGPKPGSQSCGSAGGCDEVLREQVYFPYQQSPLNTMYLAVRTTADPISLTAAVRSAVWAIDAQQPVSDIQTMAQRASTSVSQPRFILMLLTAFAGVALVLAAIGIYGVLAYAVGQRVHEIGVRMALGARPGDVSRMVLKQGGMLIGGGLIVGTVGAYLLTRLGESLLFGVTATDPLTYIIVLAGLGLVGIAACYLPARRATAVQPVTVLSAE